MTSSTAGGGSTSSSSNNNNNNPVAAGPSHYKILAVSRNATEKEIRDAYKVAVVKAHPDKGGTPQIFARLQLAYETLKDSEKRKLYDKELHQVLVARSFRRPPPLDFVKAPVTFPLTDGDAYAFETAPDRLRCKFRHGDIIANGMETGCFIGLGAFDTLYWMRQGSSHATALFSLGMGGDKGISIVLRAAPRSAANGCSSGISSPSAPAGTARRTSSFGSFAASSSSSFSFTAASTTSGNAAAPQRTRGFSPAATHPHPQSSGGGHSAGDTGGEVDMMEKLREEIIRRDKLRVIREKLARLLGEESELRRGVIDRHDMVFKEEWQMLQTRLRALPGVALLLDQHALQMRKQAALAAAFGGRTVGLTPSRRPSGTAASGTPGGAASAARATPTTNSTTMLNRSPARGVSPLPTVRAAAPALSFGNSQRTRTPLRATTTTTTTATNSSATAPARSASAPRDPPQPAAASSHVSAAIRSRGQPATNGAAGSSVLPQRTASASATVRRASIIHADPQSGVPLSLASPAAGRKMSLNAAGTPTASSSTRPPVVSSVRMSPSITVRRASTVGKAAVAAAGPVGSNGGAASTGPESQATPPSPPMVAAQQRRVSPVRRVSVSVSSPSRPSTTSPVRRSIGGLTSAPPVMTSGSSRITISPVRSPVRRPSSGSASGIPPSSPSPSRRVVGAAASPATPNLHAARSGGLPGGSGSISPTRLHFGGPPLASPARPGATLSSSLLPPSVALASMPVIKFRKSVEGTSAGAASAVRDDNE